MRRQWRQFSNVQAFTTPRTHGWHQSTLVINITETSIGWTVRTFRFSNNDDIITLYFKTIIFLTFVLNEGCISLSVVNECHSSYNNFFSCCICNKWSIVGFVCLKVRYFYTFWLWCIIRVCINISTSSTLDSFNWMCNIVFKTNLVCLTTFVTNSTYKSCINYTCCKIICDLNVITNCIWFKICANRNSTCFINKHITSFDCSPIYNMTDYITIECDIFWTGDTYTNGSESPENVILD